ncbi:uncharacterized protein LOC119998611 [Tripterygium wilfordii]|uniref:uncharacterized protein LOC119998611 n=1 Tax=Tripterygium wilfordii TaxID=458696 RepID=UPI0018F8184A|nr:uncharacterized protein LOC119998611 [Tripterygium wilfordii]
MESTSTKNAVGQTLNGQGASASNFQVPGIGMNYKDARFYRKYILDRKRKRSSQWSNVQDTNGMYYNFTVVDDTILQLEHDNVAKKIKFRDARKNRKTILDRKCKRVTQGTQLEDKGGAFTFAYKCHGMGMKFKDARMYRKYMLDRKRKRTTKGSCFQDNIENVIQRIKFRDARGYRKSILDQRRKRGTQSKQLGNIRDIVHNCGKPSYECEHCGAMLWYEERTLKSKQPTHPKFSICCMSGRVQFPFLKEAPEPLASLLNDHTSIQSSRFMKIIRTCNAAFAFTSMGGHVDMQINNSNGPYVFQLNGQNHHLIGSLIPDQGKKPCFAQLYIYDTENELQNRIDAVSYERSQQGLDLVLIKSLLAMLDEHNILVKTFRMARDRFKSGDLHDVKLCLYSSRSREGREYSLPSSTEVAGLIVGDFNPENPYRDVVVHHQAKGLQRITEMHPSFMALQYPLLFPYGEDGYRDDIRYKEIIGFENLKRGFVTMREYYARQIQQRKMEAHTLLNGGKLFLQYVVDAYTCIEEQRLRFIRTHQDTLRSELYSGLHDAVTRGDVIAEEIGKRTLLPSSHTGSPRYRIQNYQDAMAICRWAGCPDLFITFTCNPKWPEIQYMLGAIGQTNASMRPDIVDRVFQIKLHELMNDIKKNKHFGRTIAVLYTIEFQKRGLPHAHILVFLHPDDKCPTTTHIDKIISAEIPNNSQDCQGYLAVQNYMIHGPCGVLNPNAPCMKEKKCAKHFPKKYYSETTIDGNGFPIYRRRKTGASVTKRDVCLDNQYVVPYNRDLLVKYQAHLNVELCNHSRSIKYLFKYVNKQPDRATAILQLGIDKVDGQKRPSSQNIDEIKQYVDCRYISATEACWRIFQFNINYREPAVERLSFHLPNQQNIIFQDGSVLEDVVDNDRVGKTIFTEWMVCNQRHHEARELSYLEFPTKWVWHNAERTWKKRKSGKCIGRIYYTHPTSGERYYLRMLLNFVKGATSFEDIRTVDGVVYGTFKEACYALGLLGDDKEWSECLEEVAIWATGEQVRQLFATLLLFCEVSNPYALWTKHSEILVDGILYNKQKALNFPELQLSEMQIQNYALHEVDQILKKNGKSLSDFDGMPIPKQNLATDLSNRLVCEELNYDRDSLGKKFAKLYSSLNIEQVEAYDAIMESVDNKTGKTFFLSGYGGTGKTFLWETIVSKLRSEGRIVIVVASSGIAALLLPGGRTAHSRFRIPIDASEESTCDIKQGTQLSELICKTSLIIWDEAPMANKYCFESLDKTLRDILRNTFEKSSNRPFGGLTTVLGGDFRQILPVVPKGRREDIINASIKRSYLWNHIEVLELTANMRLQVASSKINKEEIHKFADWIVQIGDGVVNTDDENGWIEIPNDILLEPGPNAFQTVVDSIYPGLAEHYNDTKYLKERAILAPTNEVVDDINQFMVQKIQTEGTIYRSSDSICTQSSDMNNLDILYPTEFLNSLKISGIPKHQLTLKVGLPIMLLRNINQSKGLCNGTRLIITQLGKWFVQAEIITGTNIGERVFIPRIILSSTDTRLPFTIKRRQFPVDVCFAMTINKSQGQTLNNVGIFLSRQVFTHGQLYVAVSRVTNRKGLKILQDDKESAAKNSGLHSRIIGTKSEEELEKASDEQIESYLELYDAEPLLILQKQYMLLHNHFTGEMKGSYTSNQHVQTLIGNIILL